MKINADFTQRVVVRFQQTPWVASPAAGVERKMLDRIGQEVARATTIVRFAPGSSFEAHTHGGGEEFLVLDGVFQDETGDFPKGTYVRNPPTSRHTPATSQGATILVKLHQMHPMDRTQIQVQTDPDNGRTDLHKDEFETVWFETLAPEAGLNLDARGGAEIFVVDGSAVTERDVLDTWDWLRLPAQSQASINAGPAGAMLWIKTGHLAAEQSR
jgi:hypothetical protein